MRLENIVSIPVEQGHGTAEGRGEREKEGLGEMRELDRVKGR